MAEPRPVPTPEERAILEKFGFRTGVAYVPVDGEVIAPTPLRLEPRDVLILRLKHPIPSEQRERVRLQIQRELADAGVRNRVIVLSDCVEPVAAAAYAEPGSPLGTKGA